MIIIYNEISYKINQKEFTAKIAKTNITNQAIGDIFIPHFIQYQLNNYVVIGIDEEAFMNNNRINEIHFPADSEVQFIGKNAFSFSSVKSITIPSLVKRIEEKTFYKCNYLTNIQIFEDSELCSVGRKAFSHTNIENIFLPSKVKELGEGWCNETLNLTNITVSPKNEHFKFYNNQYLLYKSDKDYEKLVFASRKIRKAVIPSFIKEIGTSSFNDCNQLYSVEFSKDDCQLQTIGSKAFSSSRIEEIEIPFTVKKICKKAFFECKNLRKIKIPENSELRSISKGAFYTTKIHNFLITSKVEEIENCWQSYTYQPINISVSPNNKNVMYYKNELLLCKSTPSEENFDKIIFASDYLESVIIPSFVKHIGSNSFANCNRLEKIEFEENSQLQTIGKESFLYSQISDISIPRTVTKIEEKAFCFCINLESIKIPEDSELISIEENAFTQTKIKKIFIPSKVEKIADSSFNTIDDSTEFIISPHNKNYEIYNGQFLYSKQEGKLFLPLNINDEKVTIPSFIKHINSEYFSYFDNIQTVEFNEDSMLQKIDKYAFSNSVIQYIKIPNHVKIIEERAFNECKCLKKVDFNEDSELISIKKDAFRNSSIQYLFIPSKVEEIEDSWCNQATNLVDIKVSKNNEHFIYYNNQFLLYKQRKEQENYDRLVFASADIEKAVIPSFIKHIHADSFQSCIKLKTVEFEENSQIISIGKFAFSNSSIEIIKIPSKLKKLEEGVFQSCNNLKTIEFPENSELTSIESDIINSTPIEKFYIPQKVENISEYWCIQIPKFSEISVSPKNKNFITIEDKLLLYRKSIEQEKFDVLIFAVKNIKKVVIPSFVKVLRSFSFENCKSIQKIEFSENSELTSIQNCAFIFSSIEHICIPKSTKYICNNAFNYCSKLISFECLSDEINENLEFIHCNNIKLASFPNAQQVVIDVTKRSKYFIVFVHVKCNVVSLH